jgi:hypothetical protein
VSLDELSRQIAIGPPPATVISSVYAVGGSNRKLVSTPASEIEREQVEWLFPERVPLGMLTILAGVGGLGKGMWSCLLASQTPGVTLIATAEDHTGATVRPRLEAVEADLARARFIGIKQSTSRRTGSRSPTTSGCSSSWSRTSAPAWS